MVDNRQSQSLCGATCLLFYENIMLYLESYFELFES